jgi:NAD(P)H-dependent FMN reductase
MAKLIFLSGSARKDSMNKKLAKLASEFAKEIGADAKSLDLKDFEMPIYDGDLEAEKGLPENAKKLKAEFANCHGFFIASPEYNSSFSPLLKNALDWISRASEKGEAPLIAYKGKVAAIAAASPGGYGGLRGLVPLRMMLGNIGVHVLPDQVAVASAHTAFDENGKLKDEKTANMLKGLVKNLNDLANKVNS